MIEVYQLFFTILFLLCQRLETTTPNIRGLIMPNGLAAIGDIASRIMDIEIRKVKFPSIEIPIRKGPGSGKVTISNLKIDNLISSAFQLKYIPPESLALVSQNLSMLINANWEAEYEILVPLYASGYMKIKISDLNYFILIKFQSEKTHPQLEIDQCSAEIGNLNIEYVNGSVAWFINFFSTDLSTFIKSMMQKQLCIVLQTIILQKTNYVLLSLPERFQIAENFFLHFTYEKPLISDYIEETIYVEVVYGDDKCKLPITPMTYDLKTTNRMTHFLMSEQIPNCLLASAHKHSLLSFFINKDTLGGRFKKLLSTSCGVLELCIGRFVKELREKYPNQNLEFYIFSRTEPTVEITAVDIKLKSEFGVELHILPSHKQNFYKDRNANLIKKTISIALLDIVFNASIIPKIIDERLTGFVSNTSTKLRLIETSIGPFNERFLKFMEEALSTSIKLIANMIMHTGIPIPSVDNVTLSQDAIIVTNSSFVRVDSDFFYSNFTIK